jgi:hypothetical protein
VVAVSHPKSIIFTTGNQGTVENLTSACPLYNSSVLLYNEIALLDRSSNGLTAPLVQTNSNTTPDPAPDKTGNNREIEFKELNFPSLPTSPLPDSPVQTNSNMTPDPAPDKTGNNREIEFKELNLPSLPTSPLPDSPVQTNSNTTPDPTPDKTGNNREIEFKELNREYTDIPIPQGLWTLQRH